jgi:hypothetical protein
MASTSAEVHCAESCEMAEEVFDHATAARDPPSPPSLSAEMKCVAQDWSAQGLKAKRIWKGLQQRYNLNERNSPRLAAVQMFVHYHVASCVRDECPGTFHDLEIPFHRCAHSTRLLIENPLVH